MPLVDLGTKTSLEKATLKVTEGNPPGDRLIKFMFNPEKCTVKGGAQWDLKPTKAAKHGSPPHYSGAQHVSLSMTVLFDESEKGGDVSKYVDTLLTWTRPTPDTLRAQKNPAAPVLQFSWGSNKTFTEFKCVLSSVSAEYQMFRRDGTPTRASVNIQLEQVPKDFKRQNPTSGALQGRSTHIVAQGDSLQSVAFEEFGDANLWRGLALFNHVDDPLRLEAGRSLLIPSPAEAQQLSEEAPEWQ